jgi:SPP1 family predicted phage head-tail adaptor
MNSGRNREVVTVQKRTQEQDGFGQPVDTWTNLLPPPGTLRADVEKLSGRELFAAQVVGADVTTRVNTRYCAGIEADQRILFRDEVLDIESVIPNRLRTTLEILCKEVG